MRIFFIFGTGLEIPSGIIIVSFHISSIKTWTCRIEYCSIVFVLNQNCSVYYYCDVIYNDIEVYDRGLIL